MSDQTDVANTLVSLIDGLIYPNGDANPSVITTPVKIYAGWPDNQTLLTDLTASTGPLALHITVFPSPTERNVTRYQPTRRVVNVNTATYTLIASGQTVTVAGAAPSPYAPQNLAVFANNKPYIVTAGAGQTPAELAAALQALLVAGVPGTTVSGDIITFPAGARIGALRVGATAQVGRETRRTEKLFQIIVWADAPGNRSALAQAIDPVFANTPFILLPDGFAGRLHYRSTMDVDADQKQGIYRRDLNYTVEFATTITETDAQLVAVQNNLDDVNGNLIETSYS